MAAMFGHRLGVLGGLPMLERSCGIVGNEGSQALVLGILDEVCQLLVDDDELCTKFTQSSAGLAQLPFDRPAPHPVILRRPECRRSYTEHVPAEALAEVPPEMVDRLRSVCADLPEAYEEAAWVGTRWRVRRHTFAHVLAVDGGWPPAYARAAKNDGPITVLTFQSSGEELEVFSRIGHPYFRPVWRPGIVGMVLDGDTDWTEVAELVTESYCLLAPDKLVALVNRPPA
jgi:hypothetical protein